MAIARMTAGSVLTENTEVNTFDQLQELYTEGKTNKDVDILADEAADIIANIGVDFGAYSDALKATITGMTRIEAFSYLYNLIGSIDKHDGGLDNDTDFKIDGTRDIDSIFQEMGLGDNQSTITESLKDIGTKVYKDAKGIDATDQELITTLQNVQSGSTPQNLDNKAWVGMLQLQDAFGNTADEDDNGIADDLEAYNKANKTNYTEAEYQTLLEGLENGEAENGEAESSEKTYKIKDTELTITESALKALNDKLSALKIKTRYHLDMLLDFNGDGKLNVDDLIAIANGDTIITKTELEDMFLRVTDKIETVTDKIEPKKDLQKLGSQRMGKRT